MFLILGVLLMVPNLLQGRPARDGGYVRACYLSYGIPPEKIPADLCTHLLAVYSRVTNDSQLEVKSEDQTKLATLTGLKIQNPDLKVLLTVVGPSDDFARASSTDANRANFTATAVSLMTSLQLDGLDVNWEFPAFPPWERARRERRQQTLLLETLSAALHGMSPPRLLTVAVGGPPAIVAASYEVPQVAAAADFVSIMTYDLHFYQTFTPFTGHNAPLHASWWEIGYFAKLNTATIARNWLSKGLPASKMLVGIPTYGRSWKLISSGWHGVGAVSIGQWGSGFTSYVSVCNLLKNGGARKWDARAQVPYAYRDRQWVSYDDPQSVAAKADLVRSLGAAGAMVFILDNDDWAGECGEGQFPLMNVIKQKLP